MRKVQLKKKQQSLASLIWSLKEKHFLEAKALEKKYSTATGPDRLAGFTFEEEFEILLAKDTVQETAVPFTYSTWKLQNKLENLNRQVRL